MSSEQSIPLTAVRGLGPSAAVKMEQCGIHTANQLADLSIVEFKERCPQLAKRAEAFVKAARRLLKRLDISNQVASSAASPSASTEQVNSEAPEQVISTSTSEALDEVPKLKKKEKKAKKADKEKKTKSEKEKVKSKDKQDKEKKKSKKEKGDKKQKSKKDTGDKKAKKEKKKAKKD